jgi:hypothetical protein
VCHNRGVKHGWGRVILVAGAAAAALWPWPPAVVERWFGGAWYPTIQPVFTSLSNLVPVALLDVAVVAAASVVLGAFVSVWRSPRGSRWRTARRRLTQTLALGAALYLGFLLAWGLNYQRPPVTERVDFVLARVTPAAVRSLNDTALAELVRARSGLPPSLEAWPSRAEVAAGLVPGLGRAAADLGLSANVVAGRPKLTMLDPYFTRAGVSGMTDPLFLETLVASNLLPFETPAVIAHEWGHLAGLARESEASFFGWLVCVQGPPGARYSAWYDAFLLTLPALDREERRERLAALPAAVKADMRAAAERTRRDELQRVRLFAWSTYDSYLKANRVDSGVRNYGEVVRLIVGTRFESGWRPVPRSSYGK